MAVAAAAAGLAAEISCLAAPARRRLPRQSFRQQSLAWHPLARKFQAARTAVNGDVAALASSAKRIRQKTARPSSAHFGAAAAYRGVKRCGVNQRVARRLRQNDKRRMRISACRKAAA